MLSSGSAAARLDIPAVSSTQVEVKESQPVISSSLHIAAKKTAGSPLISETLEAKTSESSDTDTEMKVVEVKMIEENSKEQAKRVRESYLEKAKMKSRGLSLVSPPKKRTRRPRGTGLPDHDLLSLFPGSRQPPRIDDPNFKEKNRDFNAYMQKQQKETQRKANQRSSSRIETRHSAARKKNQGTPG